MAFVEVAVTAVIGLLPLLLLGSHGLADRLRHRGEHAEARALRCLADQARWTGR